VKSRFILTLSWWSRESIESTNPTVEKCWPPNLVEVVKRVINQPAEELRAPAFAFELSQEAAQKNHLLLANHKFNLDEALNSQKGTPLEYGSEFRNVEVLEVLFGRHSNWGGWKSY